MKKLLLETRWLGLLAVLAFALVVARVASYRLAVFLLDLAPEISAEARDFLPIALENGQIVEPADALIHKTYSDEEGNPTFNAVLNTQVDELGVEDIQSPGLYVSRKAVYIVSPQKTELRSLAGWPDMSLNGDQLDNLLKWNEKHLPKYLFLAFSIALFVFVSVAILLYASLAHLLVGKHFGADYSRTLRITVWTYLVLTPISWFAYLPGGILSKFVLILLANYLVNKVCYPKAPASEPPPVPAP